MSFRSYSSSNKNETQEKKFFDLSASLNSLKIQNEDVHTSGPTTKKYDVDPLESMGLYLASSVAPFTLDAVNQVKISLKEMATFRLGRGNFGARGVVWARYDLGNRYDATALFISKGNKYNDNYLSFLRIMNENRINGTNIQLPDILYDYPRTADPTLRPDTNSYQSKAAAMFDQLKIEAHHGTPSVSSFHTQSSSKIYVFFKIPVSGDEKYQRGPYLFFGRFAVVPPVFGDDIHQIRLRFFKPPLSAQIEYQKIPEVTDDDVESVISILSSKSSRKQRVDDDDDDDDDDEEDDEDEDELVVPRRRTPAAPNFKNPPRYRIPKKKALEEELEAGEIRE